MVPFSRFSRYFDELAAKGSIRRAAERLNVAPSAIDRQLLRAEEELGTALFERIPQGLRLTAAGELLIHGYRTWKRDYLRILSQIDDLRGLRRGNVNLAVVEGTTQDLVPDVLADFHREYSNITCTTRVATGEAVEQLVLNGDADIGLTFNPALSTGLRVNHSVNYRMGALVPPGHPLLALSVLRLSDVAAYPVVIPDDTTSLRRILDKAVKTAGVTLRPIVVTNHMSLVRSLVSRGVGIGLLTEIGALPEIANGSIIFRRLADPSIAPSVMSIVTARGRHLSVPAELLALALTDAMKTVSEPETRKANGLR